MRIFTSDYICPACDHEWQDDWTNGDTASQCPECGHHPVQPYYTEDNEDE